MRIIIQDTSGNNSASVDALIRQKVRGLSRYARALKDAVVEVRHNRRHRTGAVASVEISLHLFCHGNLPIRADETASDIHAALDAALEKIKRQLSAHKEKDRTVSRTAIRHARGK